jgi:hypothetical protein
MPKCGYLIAAPRRAAGLEPLGMGHRTAIVQGDAQFVNRAPNPAMVGDALLGLDSEVVTPPLVVQFAALRRLHVLSLLGTMVLEFPVLFLGRLVVVP